MEKDQLLSDDGTIEITNIEKEDENHPNSI